MKKTGWHISAVVGTALMIPLTLGCSGGNEPAASTGADGGSSTSQAQAGSGNAAAGTAATIVENGVGTEPAQCVAIFLDSLRRGNEEAANGVLTTKARQELAKTAYEMQPLGTPEGQYEIGRVGFPYEDKTVALVECTWTEPPLPGEGQVTMDIVCEVHQEQEGWRISGIGVTIPGTDDALVLDFEDAAALQATIDAATGQAPSGAAPQQNPPQQQIAGQQQASASTAGLPAYPSQLPTYPSQGNEIAEENSPPPQIALPPYQGTINR